MKIAVLGANGFVGSSIVGNLSNKHEVVPVSRETLNLLMLPPQWQILME